MARWTRLTALLILVTLTACGGPPPSRLDRLYAGLDESLPYHDPTLLAGRRILIDPGHGGYFRGTVGADSLEESSVNLGVSLYLWGLLREAGADVYLTRSIDRDFLTPADSALASDLEHRVAMADSLRPDVFVSIHHNAEPERRPETNQVETYYKAGDPASMDLAFSIHRHLMRNLGIDVGEVRQGNYYVLRENDAPSVLGESSYLTHPPVEKKIQLSNVQRLEAEAYFLGIVDYFSRGLPRIAWAGAPDSVITETGALTWTLVDDGGMGIDPESIELIVSGDRVTPAISPSVDAPGGIDVTWSLPEDTPNGPVSAVVLARNIGGNTSRPDTRALYLTHPPTIAAIVVTPARLPPDTPGIVRVRVRLLDRRGLPVADGTPVTANVRGAGEVTGITRGGAFEFGAAHGSSGVLRLDITSGDGSFPHTVERASVPRGATIPAPPMWSRVVLRNALTGAPINEAIVENGASIPSRSAVGEHFMFAPGARVRAAGYRPHAGAVTDTLSLSPWYGGVLYGKRFVLDPQGGRASDIGAGALGLNASAINLKVAQYLAAMLRDAGAQVTLTRTTEEVRTPEDVARLTNRWRADRYIEIRHPLEPADSALAVRAYHFPGSRTGRTIAPQLAGAVAARTGVPARAPLQTVTYPLQQTACPAVVVAFPSIGIRSEELRLDRSSYLREQAWGLMDGLLDHFACPDTADVTIQMTGPDTEGWLIVLDETWTQVTAGSGAVVFRHMPAGTLHVRAQRGAQRIDAMVEVTGPGARVEIPSR